MKIKTSLYIGLVFLIIISAVILYAVERRKSLARAIDLQRRQQYRIPETEDMTDEQIADLKSQLQRAIRYGHVDIVQRILEIVPFDPADGDWMLFAAVIADRNSGELVRIMLNLGLTQVNLRDSEGRLTLLHYAAFYGHHEAAELLIKHGAGVNALDRDSKSGPSFQRTPLHVSAHHGTWRVAKVLLENGANVNAKDSSGFTPLQEALSGTDPQRQSAWGKQKIARMIQRRMQEQKSGG